MRRGWVRSGSVPFTMSFNETSSSRIFNSDPSADFPDVLVPIVVVVAFDTEASAEGVIVALAVEGVADDMVEQEDTQFIDIKM
mmetsp:Transcript_29615/g.61760  ORF Transcript_29615/g.61760 Transcript_29615/m.61760 type:complete len:83 (-) Transcript_29615:218-466(-)